MNNGKQISFEKISFSVVYGRNMGLEMVLVLYWVVDGICIPHFKFGNLLAYYNQVYFFHLRFLVLMNPLG